MNTKNITIALSVLFTYLVYEEGSGINVLLLNLVLLSVLIYQNKTEIQNPRNLLFLFAAIISSVMVAIHGHFLAVLTNIISLAFLSLSIHLNKSSALSLFVQSVYAYASTWLIKIGQLKQESQQKNEEEAESENTQFKVNKWLIGIISFIVFWAFISFYRYSSANFNQFVLNINLELPPFSLILCFAFGTLLISTFLQPYILNRLANHENNTLSHLPYTTFMDYEVLSTRINEITENSMATFLFGGLNLLLLLVNILDTQFLFTGNLPEGENYSEYLHQGIFSLILSIICAIAMILWFFRGSQNFSNKTTIKGLAFTWILLNLWLLLSAAYRNQLYIEEFSLTYKRIGVFIFLLCAFAGLILTFIKIYHKRSNYFLIQSNSMFWFILLVLSSTINWDRNLADYNISRSIQKNQIPDIWYLSTLSYQAYPSVISYCLAHPNKDAASQHEMQNNSVSNMLNKIIQNEYDYSWQSFNYSRCKGYSEINQMIRNQPDETIGRSEKNLIGIFNEFRNPLNF